MPDIEGVPYEAAGTALDVATAQALAARHREAAAAGVRAETAVTTAQARADDAYALADAAATPAMVDQKVSTATTGLVTEAALADALDGFSGGGVESVSGTVTLDATGEPIREFFTTGATVFQANGTSVSIGAGVAVVWRRVDSVWSFQQVLDGWTTPTPTPDTTKPTAGTLASSNVSDKSFTLTVSGASDDRGLHTAPYRFSTDGGSTWTAYQASNTLAVTGKTASTAYTCKAEVRDAAGNTAQTASVTVTTLAVAPWGTLYADSFTAPDGTALVGRAVETGPTPKPVYQQVGTSAPSLTGGKIPATVDKTITITSNGRKFNGAMIDVGVSDRVQFTASWTSGSTHSDGVGLALYGQDATHLHILWLSGVSNNWGYVNGNVSGTGSEVATSPTNLPAFGTPHTLEATFVRSGTTATVNITVDGKPYLVDKVLNVAATGTMFGVGTCAALSDNAPNAVVDEWSVRAE